MTTTLKFPKRGGKFTIPQDAEFTIVQMSGLDVDTIIAIAELLDKAQGGGVHPQIEKASVSGTGCSGTGGFSDFQCGDSDN
jgi:hypothetical protein